MSVILTTGIIQDFFGIIDCYNRSDQTPNVIPLLQQWQSNKEDIYRLFNEQLIIKYPINLSVTKDDYQNIKKGFISQLNRSLMAANTHYFLNTNVDATSLIKNSLQYDTIIKDIYFPKGTKISKIFKKIMEPVNFVLFDKLYSNLLQTLSIQGNLCISIHPLDYLTMGDNSMKWTSCHSLQGEYCGGLLSLLIDKSTVVCYVESNTTAHFINDIIWNSKKWRQLIHLDPEQKTILFNTQYPYEHDLVHKTLINKLQNLFDINTQLYEIPTSSETVPKICMDYTDIDVLHHNDLLCIKITGEYENEILKLLAPTDFAVNKMKPILIGLPPYCPICGNYIVTYHYSLECEHCNPFDACCNCGEMYVAIDLHEINNELFCDTCFDEYFEYCEICDELISKGSSRLGLHNCEEEGKIVLFG